MANKHPFRILFIEDIPADVELAVILLRKEDINFEYSAVCTRKDLIRELKEFRPGLIISDYMMPSFNGMEALRIVKEFDPRLPFILYTGSVHETIAVECIKAGANDYVIKEHKTRLPFAVKEALAQVNIQKEKRASELLLIENEEKLQSIFRAAPVGIGLIVKRTIIEVNDAFCEITGYDRNELIGKSSEMLSSSEGALEFVLEDYIKKIKGKTNGSLETIILNKKRKILNVLLGVSHLDINDFSKGVTITILDITERKRVETALRESEERFRSLYEDAVVGLYRTTPEGRILLANQAIVKMLGFQSFEELAENNLNEVSYGPSYQRKSFIDQIEKNGEIRDLETTWLSRVGKEINIKESAKAIRDSEGKVLYYDGTVEDITEKIKAAEALNKMQHMFETLTLISPVGIFRTDPEGSTTFVNPKWTELSGMSSEEALGNGWLKAVHPEDRDRLYLEWEENFKSRKESASDYRFLRPDGSIVWVMGNAVPEVSDNKIVGYIGTVTDITDRKSAEEALMASETKYRQLVTHSPDGIFIVDLSGKFLAVNSAICKGLNFTEKELLTMNIWDVVPEKYHSLHAGRLMTIMKGESTKANVEYEVKSVDGITHYIEVLSVPFYRGKNIIGFQGIARDVSERKRSEIVLRKSEERYRLIFENIQDLYYETTMTGTILEVSPSIAYLSKGLYRREDLIGKSMYDFFTDSIDREKFLNVLKEEGSVYDFEIMLHNRNGMDIPCSISSKLLFDENGIPEKIIGSVRDITDRKNASDSLRLSKEKAEASDRLKTAFLNNISHEVRTPLNGIMGFAEIISQPGLSPDEKAESLNILHESSDRLLNTITNYMEISLLTSGNLSVHTGDFYPGIVFRKSFTDFRDKCSKKKLDLILEIPEESDLIQINSDQDIFQKIFSHLVDNAIKFTEIGRVTFGFLWDNGECEYFVKDTGIGISRESYEVIFEHFAKEDSGKFRSFEGSGLGLAIVKGMIDLVGGKIRVESEVGKGSCFYFTIPSTIDSDKWVTDYTEGEKKIASGKFQVLIAEDDEANYIYLRTVLRSELGASVLHASNGVEALELFKANPDIKLIIMDIKMPVMDGLEATRQIKAINRDIPILSITAYAMTGDMDLVLASGCDGYLSKPINKRTLLEKISELIKI